MSEEVIVSNKAKKALIEFNGGAFSVTELDMDLFTLLSSIKPEDRRKKAVPRYLLACLNDKYNTEEEPTNVTVKSITGRLRVYHDRGLVTKHEKAKGDIFPTWSTSEKFTTLMNKTNKEGKSALEVCVDKGWDASSVNIDQVNTEVLNATASVNGRYKDGRGVSKSGKVDINDSEDFA